MTLVCAWNTRRFGALASFQKCPAWPRVCARSCSRRSTDVPPRAASAYSMPALTTRTEIVLVSGTCCRVEGKAEDVEKQILDAARGSLLELVWLTETESGQRIALNPEHVVLLRADSS